MQPLYRLLIGGEGSRDTPSTVPVIRLDHVARAAPLAEVLEILLFGQFLHMYFDGVAVGAGGFFDFLDGDLSARSTSSRIRRGRAGRDARRCRSSTTSSGLSSFCFRHRLQEEHQPGRRSSALPCGWGRCAAAQREEQPSLSRSMMLSIEL